MARPALEVADILRDHGPARRAANAGHASLAQLRVMSAIETCRTAALGGHVAACDACGREQVAYNSRKNRHRPKCQGSAARDWMAAQGGGDLLPVECFHVVFTVPAAVAEIAFWNKAAVYTLLFRASARTMTAIAAAPRHLGARIGMTSVLRSWDSASCRRRASATMTCHPHIHMVAPCGGLSADGGRRIACRRGFLMPVKVLGRLFRRLLLEGLAAMRHAGGLRFFGARAGLADPAAFAAHLAPLRRADWVVYAKPPFGGPEQVLAYLSRYTHRVAISNRRLVSADALTVAFTWKDYRAPERRRRRVMRLATDELIQRFLLHVLPDGFHWVRHYGLLASAARRRSVATIRALLGASPVAAAPPETTPPAPKAAAEPAARLASPRPCCGGPMRLVERFKRGRQPHARAPPWGSS